MLPATVVLVVLVLVAALVAERQVSARAPREAERRLTQWLGVPTAVVAVGRPRDWVRHRTIPAVSLAAEHLPIPDSRASIDRLEVELRGVRIEGPRTARRVLAAEGSFKAVLSESQVRHLVELPPLVRRLDLRDDRVRLITSAGLSVDLRLFAQDGALVLKPMGNPLDVFLPVRHRIPLDNLPAGASVDRAVIRDGQLVVTGPIDGSRLSGGDEDRAE